MPTNPASATFAVYPHTICPATSTITVDAWQIPPKVLSELSPGDAVFYTHVRQGGLGHGVFEGWCNSDPLVRVDVESFDPDAVPDPDTMASGQQKPLFIVDLQEMCDGGLYASYSTLSAEQIRVLSVGDWVWFTDFDGGLGCAQVVQLRSRDVRLRVDMESFSWDAHLPAPYNDPVYSRV